MPTIPVGRARARTPASLAQLEASKALDKTTARHLYGFLHSVVKDDGCGRHPVALSTSFPEGEQYEWPVCNAGNPCVGTTSSLKASDNLTARLSGAFRAYCSYACFDP